MPGKGMKRFVSGIFSAVWGLWGEGGIIKLGCTVVEDQLPNNQNKIK